MPGERRAVEFQREGKASGQTHTTLLPSPCREARSHRSSHRGRGALTGGCKNWGLLDAPPRLSVCVCERVWRGQRRTLCSGRG
jgi:hypothetical protein